MLESQQLRASAFAIARSGLGKAIAFKNGQASKLPIHSREIFKEAIARSGQLSVAHLLPLLMSCEAREGVACRINCGQSACS